MVYIDQKKKIKKVKMLNIETWVYMLSKWKYEQYENITIFLRIYN